MPAELRCGAGTKNLPYPCLHILTKQIGAGPGLSLVNLLNELLMRLGSRRARACCCQRAGSKLCESAQPRLTFVVRRLSMEHRPIDRHNPDLSSRKRHAAL